MVETRIVAELSGRIISLSVGVGDKVGEGQEVAVVEAMKMEIPLASPVSGVVVGVFCQPDEMVSEGAPILSIKFASEEGSHDA
ncbi:acetyl-CoA carboxylase biotin carboxyl carrier protein subunit [Bradyrhizobium sp. WSM 4400]|nr:acetyl-CoA carboxylase biotin carboxyl carrier protein subunit [Bradyrhizobium australafricanum]